MTKPCPFCGVALTRGYSHQGDVVSWDHPKTDPRCIMGRQSIGVAIIDRWERRTDVVHMQIVDDHPIFNLTGEGQPVGIDMINKTIAYYKEQAQ